MPYFLVFEVNSPLEYSIPVHSEILGSVFIELGRDFICGVLFCRAHGDDALDTFDIAGDIVRGDGRPERLLLRHNSHHLWCSPHLLRPHRERTVRTRRKADLIGAVVIDSEGRSLTRLRLLNSDGLIGGQSHLRALEEVLIRVYLTNLIYHCYRTLLMLNNRLRQM